MRYRTQLLKATITKRILFFLLADGMLSLFSLYLAYLLRFNFAIPEPFWGSFWKLYALLTTLKISSLILFGLYNFTWRFFGLYEAKRLFLAITLAYLGAALLLWLFYDLFTPFPRSAIMIDYLLSLLFLGAIRGFKRLLLESSAAQAPREAILYGLNRHLLSLAPELGYKIVAIVDESRAGSRVAGVPIIPEERALGLPATTLIIAKELPPKELGDLIHRFKASGITQFKRLSLQSEGIEDISIEDLLARRPADLDQKQIASFIKGKRILITGAGGSIGSELVRQAKAYGASQIIAFESSEYNLYRLKEEHPEIVSILGDVTSVEDVDAALKEHRPDLILHAAAYKHVPLGEENPRATVRNNVLGTKVILEQAIAHEIPHLVLISTDKAVNPTNVMGASKRVCELLAQNIPSSKTTISAVRFGNVLGSSGSVIPKFQDQIRSGGPVTITHPEIRRYFMLTSEACQLVLQAASLAKGQEIFILDMGKPVKIVDLAKRMMELMGKEVPILFTGLRPGEKLYEELLIEGAERGTKYESIYIAKADRIDFSWLDRQIDTLLQARNRDEIVKILQSIVKEYRPQNAPPSAASAPSGSPASRSADNQDSTRKSHTTP